jgi:hypothetical protein
MYTGADPDTTPGGTKQPHTNEEDRALTMVAFKNKINLKAFTPFKDETKWVQWWSHFKITLGSQGMEAVLGATYVPAEPDEALGFIRMQDTVYAALSEQIQMPTAKSILRQFRHTRNAQDSIIALIECHRTSTRAPASTHATLRLIASRSSTVISSDCVETSLQYTPTTFTIIKSRLPTIQTLNWRSHLC